MIFFNSIAQNHTKFQGKIRFRIKIIINKKLKKNSFLNFLHKTLRWHCKVPHKFLSSNSNFQNIGLKGLKEEVSGGKGYLGQGANWERGGYWEVNVVG